MFLPKGRLVFLVLGLFVCCRELHRPSAKARGVRRKASVSVFEGKDAHCRAGYMTTAQR